MFREGNARTRIQLCLTPSPCLSAPAALTEASMDPASAQEVSGKQRWASSYTGIILVFLPEGGTHTSYLSCLAERKQERLQALDPGKKTRCGSFGSIPHFIKTQLPVTKYEAPVKKFELLLRPDLSLLSYTLTPRNDRSVITCCHYGFEGYTTSQTLTPLI